MNAFISFILNNQYLIDRS